MAHDHNYDHEERELITLVTNKEMKPCLEILWPSMAKKNLGKNFWSLADAEEDEKRRSWNPNIIHLQKKKTEQKVTFQLQSQKTPMDMIEAVFNTLWRSKARDVYSQPPKN